jgi:hypothetical protein
MLRPRNRVHHCKRRVPLRRNESSAALGFYLRARNALSAPRSGADVRRASSFAKTRVALTWRNPARSRFVAYRQSREVRRFAERSRPTRSDPGSQRSRRSNPNLTSTEVRASYCGATQLFGFCTAITRSATEKGRTLINLAARRGVEDHACRAKAPVDVRGCDCQFPKHPAAHYQALT